MSTLMTQLGIHQLSAEDRLNLAHDIWESVAAEGRSRLTEAQAREFQQRIEDDDRFPDDVIPWEQVKAEGQSRIGR